MAKTLLIKSQSDDDTFKIGKIIGKSFINKGGLILLSGVLGAGKTTLIKGIASAFEINENVTSPTFDIVKCYKNNKIDFYHIDAYRLENENNDIGLAEIINCDSAMVVIEWPIFIKKIICKPYLEIILKYTDNFTCRKITINVPDEYKKVFNEKILFNFR